MKVELGEKVVTKFVELRAKTDIYLADDGSEDKKSKGTKKCLIKRPLIFQNCKNCLEATQLDNKVKYVEKNETNLDSLKKSERVHIKQQINIKNIAKVYK